MPLRNANGIDEMQASTAIITEVAARESVEPTELTPRLGEVVDPDAIDSLFTDGTLDATLEFTYCGYQVTVHDDETVLVEDDLHVGAGERTAGSSAPGNVD